MLTYCVAFFPRSKEKKVVRSEWLSGDLATSHYPVGVPDKVQLHKYLQKKLPFTEEDFDVFPVEIIPGTFSGEFSVCFLILTLFTI